MSRTAIAICLVLFLGVSAANGIIVTIEADDFTPVDIFGPGPPDPQWYSMHEPAEGIKLWRCDYRTPFENALSSRYADIFAIASTNLDKPLGDNVIGNPIPPVADGPVEDWWWDYWSDGPYLLLEVDGLLKDITVHSVTRPGWLVKTFVIDLYAPDGELVGHNFTKGSALTSHLGDYEAKYAMLWTVGARSFDDITVNYIPEPAMILILGLGFLFIRKIK